jgi:RNA polymerase sigma-70 factor (ECF subfamily)
LQQDKQTITIIEGCKKGNRKAQEQLYRDYYKAMIAICLRYTKNDEDAVEVLNNGFYKVFKNIRQYNAAKGGLYTWIRTIVINCCIDFISAKSTPAVVELETAEEPHVLPEVLSNIKTDALLQFVKQLPPATQAVFNLYAIEGYSHKEVASMLRISEGTSKWHLSEAKKNLQQLIRQETQLNG